VSVRRTCLAVLLGLTLLPAVFPLPAHAGKGEIRFVETDVDLRADRAIRKEMIIAEMLLFKGRKQKIWKGMLWLSGKEEALQMLDRIIDEWARDTPVAEQAHRLPFCSSTARERQASRRAVSPFPASSRASSDPRR